MVLRARNRPKRPNRPPRDQVTVSFTSPDRRKGRPLRFGVGSDPLPCRSPFGFLGQHMKQNKKQTERLAVPVLRLRLMFLRGSIKGGF